MMAGIEPGFKDEERSHAPTRTLLPQLTQQQPSERVMRAPVASPGIVYDASTNSYVIRVAGPSYAHQNVAPLPTAPYDYLHGFHFLGNFPPGMCQVLPGHAPPHYFPNQGPSIASGPGPPIQLVPENELQNMCNLFVFHIPNEMTNLDLFHAFSVHGNVVSARIIVEQPSGRPKGYGKIGECALGCWEIKAFSFGTLLIGSCIVLSGFITYDESSSGTKAIAAMNGLQMGNKKLKVQYKKEKGSWDPDYGPGLGKSQCWSQSRYSFTRSPAGRRRGHSRFSAGNDLSVGDLDFDLPSCDDLHF